MRDLGFFCLANLAADLAHFLWAHLRVPMAQFKGEKKVNLVFQVVEGTPDEGNGSNSYRRLVVAKRCDWQCS